ncbi:hypothetical protein KM908_13915 [Alkalihalobacillus clausii]|uniref:hypothetical protein n=1 Tax=Shouchella clausii TaxID=79880 RepID=UPI001C2276C4|nr:hypothetical protein [Shouchella clausii]MBU8597238.1 hypothetical protein [Shouchella clausii]
MESSLIVTEKEIQDFLENARDNQEASMKKVEQINELQERMIEDIREQAKRLTPVFRFLKEHKHVFVDEFSGRSHTKGPVLNYDARNNELYFYCIESESFKKITLYDESKPATVINPRMILRVIEYEKIMINLSRHLEYYSRFIQECDETIQNWTNLRRKFAPEFN